MSIENVKKFLDSAGLLDRYIELSGSTATVELAAQQLNCEQARIAKSMAMLLKNGDAIVIVTNGTAKIDNSKYKAFFKEKAHFCQWAVSFRYLENRSPHKRLICSMSLCSEGFSCPCQMRCPLISGGR